MKNKKIIFGIVFIILQFIPSFLINVKAAAEVTDYYDYSELKSLSINYSYSTILINEDTEIKIVEDKTTGTIKKTGLNTIGDKELPDITLKAGQEAVFIITNCAVNKFGEKLDVVITINNVHTYDTENLKETPRIKITLQNSIKMLESQDQANPTDYYTKNLNIGDPIEFYLYAYYAYCDFTMSYYKAGTYNPTTGKGVDGKVEYVNGFFNDFDAYSNQCSRYEFLCGSEGLVPQSGHSSIYYKKNSDDTVQEGYARKLVAKDNGIAVGGNLTGSNTDAWWYAQTALILTDSIKNSTYTFTYGGLSCRLDYFFSPPYPYDSVPNPLRNISKKNIIPGESLTYSTSQYMPNSYYSMAFGFEKIYSNFYANPDFFDKAAFTYFSLHDNINNLFDINKEKISVTNETGFDVTNCFDIKVDGNNVVATLKSENFEDSTFYSHTYSLNVPVTLKNNTANIGHITDTSSSIYKLGERDNVITNTNAVTVNIDYILTINYIDQATGDKIADSVTKRLAYGEKYTTDFSMIEWLWHLEKAPSNASGTVTKNDEINYYFVYNPKKIVTILVNYLEKDTNNPIAEAEIIEVSEGEEYTTDYSKIGSGWKLVKIPENATGTANDNIIVNYYFEKVVEEIENPPTGYKNILIVIMVLALVVILYIKKLKPRIYKI